MNEQLDSASFLAYIGGADFHDATVLAQDVHGSEMDVSLKAADGHRFVVHFSGVEAVRANRPEGMMLYALAELKGQAPHRRFSFVNWDEKDDAKLEVTATEYRITKSEIE